MMAAFVDYKQAESYDFNFWFEAEGWSRTMPRTMPMGTWAQFWLDIVLSHKRITK